MGRVLIVDDEKNVLSSLEKILASSGHETLTGRRAEDAIAAVSTGAPEVVIMDVRMPGMNGLDAFRRIREMQPRLPVIIMTGHGTTDSAIEATKLGAFEYLMKPFEPEVLLRLVDQALECVRLMRGNVLLSQVPGPLEDEAIIGDTPVMQEVYKAIGRVAQTDATVLIRGETGTGKELVARAIYQHSRRSKAPLLLLNCAAIPEPLLESELFGHERGAFTGAESRRIGKFEQANGGTVFLDEIGDIPAGIQAKLLRVLQERRFERIGGNDSIEVDIRLIAATNRDLERAMAEKRFRVDLYHRLNVVTVTLPPLRDRRDDIPRLVGYFVGRFARQLKMELPVVTEEAMKLLRSTDWPGNVRELEHCLHRALIFSRGYPIQAEDIGKALQRKGVELDATGGSQDGGIGSLVDVPRAFIREYLESYAGPSAHRDAIDLIDKILVLEALRITYGNQTHAAKLLGLTRPTLQAKMHRYGIRRETSVRDD